MNLAFVLNFRVNLPARLSSSSLSAPRRSCVPVLLSPFRSPHPRRLSVRAHLSADESTQELRTTTCLMPEVVSFNSIHLQTFPNTKACEAERKRRPFENDLRLVLPAASTSQRHNTKPASRKAMTRPWGRIGSVLELEDSQKCRAELQVCFALPSTVDLDAPLERVAMQAR